MKKIEDYSFTLYLRELIEKETGKKCIPVYHLHRGKQGWEELVHNYNYIAIGGIAGATLQEYTKMLKILVKDAKKHNVKVHGLGYTSKNIKDIGFYSVDSTSWLGTKYGQVYTYDGINKKPIRTTGNGRRLKTEKIPIINQNNFNVWYKYQQNLLKEGDIL